MAQPVTIENDAIKMQVWPQLGGKVSSIVDKADKFELLFNYPAELPETSQYDRPYQSGWYAGWDECFPAIAASRYTGHPYDGIAVPDHGELWGLPTTAVPTKDGITTVWHGLRFGYRLTRKLFLDGPAVLAEYTLINLAPFEMRFVWSQHALLSLVAPAELGLAHAPLFRWSHDAAGNEVQKTFEWPVTPDGDNLSRPAGLPPGKGWKTYSAEPIESSLVVRYPSRSRTVQIEYESEDDLHAYVDGQLRPDRAIPSNGRAG